MCNSVYLDASPSSGRSSLVAAPACACLGAHFERGWIWSWPDLVLLLLVRPSHKILGEQHLVVLTATLPAAESSVVVLLGRVSSVREELTLCESELELPGDCNLKAVTYCTAISGRTHTMLAGLAEVASSASTAIAVGVANAADTVSTAMDAGAASKDKSAAGIAAAARKTENVKAVHSQGRADTLTASHRGLRPKRPEGLKAGRKASDRSEQCTRNSGGDLLRVMKAKGERTTTNTGDALATSDY